MREQAYGLLRRHDFIGAPLKDVLKGSSFSGFRPSPEWQQEREWQWTYIARKTTRMV